MIKLKSLLLEGGYFFPPSERIDKIRELMGGLGNLKWKMSRKLEGNKYINFFLHKEINKVHTLIELKMLPYPLDVSSLGDNVIEYLCRMLDRKSNSKFENAFPASLKGTIPINSDMSEVAIILNDKIEKFVSQKSRAFKRRK